MDLLILFYWLCGSDETTEPAISGNMEFASFSLIFGTWLVF